MNGNGSLGRDDIIAVVKITGALRSHKEGIDRIANLLLAVCITLGTANFTNEYGWGVSFDGDSQPYLIIFDRASEGNELPEKRDDKTKEPAPTESKPPKRPALSIDDFNLDRGRPDG
jgi:hypothetical protein